jgi:hypothetical protein
MARGALSATLVALILEMQNARHMLATELQAQARDVRRAAAARDCINALVRALETPNILRNPPRSESSRPLGSSLDCLIGLPHLARRGGGLLSSCGLVECVP